MYNYISNGCYNFCIFICLKIENVKVITRGRQACIQMRVTAFKCKCKCAKWFKCKCKCKCTAFEANANANASAQHLNQMQMKMHLNQMQMQMQMQMQTILWWSTHQLVSCNGSANDWHNASMLMANQITFAVIEANSLRKSTFPLKATKN